MEEVNLKEIAKEFQEGKTLEQLEEKYRVSKNKLAILLPNYFAMKSEDLSDIETFKKEYESSEGRDKKVRVAKKYGLTIRQASMLIRQVNYKTPKSGESKKRKLDERLSRDRLNPVSQKIMSEYEDGYTPEEILMLHDDLSIVSIRQKLRYGYQAIGQTMKRQLKKEIVENNIQHFLREGRTLEQIYTSLQETGRIIPKTIKEKYFQEIIQAQAKSDELEI